MRHICLQSPKDGDISDHLTQVVIIFLDAARVSDLEFYAILGLSRMIDKDLLLSSQQHQVVAMLMLKAQTAFFTVRTVSMNALYQLLSTHRHDTDIFTSAEYLEFLLQKAIDVNYRVRLETIKSIYILGYTSQVSPANSNANNHLMISTMINSLQDPVADVRQVCIGALANLLAKYFVSTRYADEVLHLVLLGIAKEAMKENIKMATYRAVTNYLRQRNLNRSSQRPRRQSIRSEILDNSMMDKVSGDAIGEYVSRSLPSPSAYNYIHDDIAMILLYESSSRHYNARYTILSCLYELCRGGIVKPESIDHEIMCKTLLQRVNEKHNRQLDVIARHIQALAKQFSIGKDVAAIIIEYVGLNDLYDVSCAKAIQCLQFMSHEVLPADMIDLVRDCINRKCHDRSDVIRRAAKDCNIALRLNYVA